MNASFDKRRGVSEGPGREAIDAHIAKAIDELVREVEVELQPSTIEAPPKAMATAMAQALSSQAHLSILFRTPVFQATGSFEAPDSGGADFPVVIDPLKIREALDLPEWQLHSLREEVDRRAGAILKRQRALDWLWGHFGLPNASPEPLFRVLFPSASHAVGRVELARWGAQLYAILDQEDPAPESTLYVGCAADACGTLVDTIGPFGGRYVARSLRKALGRGIGADDAEVVAILDEMIAFVPRSRFERYLQHDRWRVRGLAGITHVAFDYNAARVITDDITPELVNVDAWLGVDADGSLISANERSAFDTLALPRVGAMVKLIYGEMLARLLSRADDDQLAALSDDLVCFDVSGHLRRALDPLLRWLQSEEVHAHLATRFKVPVRDVAELLAKVHVEWSAQLERGWCAAPRPREPRSVASVIVLHLVQTWRSLRRIQVRTTDPRYEHRDLLLLAAGHYLCDARIQRLWSEGLTDVGAPAVEPFAETFWAAWMRLLETLDEDTSTFSGPFTLDS